MNQVIPIAAGGALGALLRYWLVAGVQAVAGPGFPYGTLLVNISGCIAIGVLYVLFVERPEMHVAWRAGLIVGLLGAYTTFSAFSLETLQLVEAGQAAKAALYVGLSVVFCLSGCWFGLAVGRWIQP